MLRELVLRTPGHFTPHSWTIVSTKEACHEHQLPAPNAGVLVAPPRPKEGAEEIAPKAGVLAGAPKAGVEAAPKAGCNSQGNGCDTPVRLMATDVLCNSHWHSSLAAPTCDAPKVVLPKLPKAAPAGLAACSGEQ
jgi:hypothetical protein